ncbi:hypothetical protein ABZ611_01545 [Streptomyces sp. NPDC007861]|uniref:hypothetical protein n=1 Tax=Streptomyces sp. NPDC007861 TaxID=3154893 RepID=UPI00340CD4FC
MIKLMPRRAHQWALTIAAAVALGGGAETAAAEQIPFPGAGYVRVEGPTAPGGLVAITVKEEPGNPHPTAVSMSSPALESDAPLGDTGRAWVGAARVPAATKPGTYKVKFELTYKDAQCVNEEDRDSVCDYEPNVLWSRVTVATAVGGQSGGLGFGQGAAVGAAGSALAAVAAVIVVRRRSRRSSSRTASNP